MAGSGVLQSIMRFAKKVALSLKFRFLSNDMIKTWKYLQIVNNNNENNINNRNNNKCSNKPNNYRHYFVCMQTILNHSYPGQLFLFLLLEIC